MNINNIGSTNFKGGFRFPNMPAEAKEKLPEVVKKRRQIFDNFEKSGDVFYTVRDKSDGKLIKFIQNHNLTFEYYPQISTKSGLDTEEPQKLSKLLKDTRPTPITTLTQLKKAISGRKNDGKTLLASDKDIEKIFETLELELDKVKTTVSPSGCKIVKDLETGEKIWISPASKNNIHYVLIEPKSLEQNVERYAISKDGQILAEYKSINGIKQFKENFNSTLIKKEK